MRKLLALTTLLILTACTPHTQQTYDFVLPQELSHCKVYQMSDSSANRIRVVHCPNASTTTAHMSGKVMTSTTVISE